MKDNVNIRIDEETGKELKAFLDEGYVMGDLEILRAVGSNPAIYFIKLVAKASVPALAALLPATGTRQSAAPGADVSSLVDGAGKFKDGDPEIIERQEPMPPKGARQGIVTSDDPNKPTLAQVIDKIIENNKNANLEGKALLDKCIMDVKGMKYDIQVENACIKYVGQKL